MAVQRAALLPHQPVLIIADGLKSQELLQQDAETWLQWAGTRDEKPSTARRPLFYPAWEHLPHEDKLPHADIITERLDTLCQLLSWRDSESEPTSLAPVVVTSIQALMQRTLAPEVLTASMKSIRVGDQMDPLDLVEWLEEQAYEPEAKVTQKGEISLRGGILDVFVMTHPWPTRIEFFGDEITSIRSFDPNTQKSRETMEHLTFSPGGELGLLKKAVEANRDSMAFASLFNFLPTGTCLVWCDPGSIQESAEDYLIEVPEEDPYYLDWDQVLQKALGTSFVNHSLEPTSPLPGDPHALGFSEEKGWSLFDPQMESMSHYRPMGTIRPEMPVMEAQRKDFMEQMHRWLRQGFTVVVVCHHEAEAHRFSEIWAEHRLDEDGSSQPQVLIGTLREGMIAEALQWVVVTDAEIFGRYKIQRPRRLKSAHAVATRSIMQIDFSDLEEGDYVVHLQHGIGRFQGLRRLPAMASKPGQETSEQGAEYLVIEYASKGWSESPPKLYVPVSEAHLVSKYIGGGKSRPPLNTLGSKRWQTTKNQAEKAVRDLAGDLLKIQAMRDAESGFAFETDGAWQREFESAFPHEETQDQWDAIDATKKDMERPKAMDRLVCGDVGFGKTEVAIRAAFKAVMGGRQVAVLVPTTVLAQQHYNTFADRMAPYPIRVEWLSRFQKPSQAKAVIQQLATGSVDIVIGTHKLIQKSVAFKNLGLVIIDEEQRFGVAQKESFKQMRKLVDVLTLSATPIPRTLHLALMGARDMSTIETPPQDRLPVETIVIPFDEEVIQNALRRELQRQGQVYFLHNRVSTIEAVASRIQALVPEARIVIGHGQMEAKILEGVMRQFINGEADILVSTTIIESGIDIPNANTIMIDRADRFGLSELYQLRGRVGRYKHQAYAYLLLPRHAGLLTDARKRLSAMKQYSKLGSGFKIAMRDLEIRGAGNLLGAQQSGHITAIGFDLYCQLLKQSIQSLQGETSAPRIDIRVHLDFLAMSPEEVTPQKNSSPKKQQHPRKTKAEHIQIPRETATMVESSDGMMETIQPEAVLVKEACYLPHSYVQEPQQRIEIYRKIAQIHDTDGSQSLKSELRDRYGPLPEMVERLLLLADLKWQASRKGISEMETSKLRLKLKRNDEWMMVQGKFPRLETKKATAQLKAITTMIHAL